MELRLSYARDMSEAATPGKPDTPGKVVPPSRPAPPGPGLYRLLALAPVMGAATAYRAGVANATAWYEGAPRLMNLWFDAIEPGRDQAEAATELSQEVLSLMEESSNVVHKELDRGISDLREFSSRGSEPEADAAAAESAF